MPASVIAWDIEIAQSIFRQFADDIQLKDLLAKAEALIVAKAAPKDTPLTVRFRDETPSNESSKKTPSKRARLKKVAPKKTSPKKKKKRAPKPRVKARA